MPERNQLKGRYRFAGLSVLALLLAACSGAPVTGNSADSAPAATNSSGTSAPEAATLKLTGSPSTSVAAGVEYSFKPTVSPTTQTVSFTVQGQPAWAQFNATTGELSGTPPASDEGQSSKVTIVASANGSTAALGPFAILITAPAPTAATPTGSATLSWTAPTSNTDGSPISGLAGYHIYYGTDPSNLTASIDVVGAATTTYAVTGLAPGTYYFAVNAYNSDGLDSPTSSVADATI
jgi:hypothetical protein